MDKYEQEMIETVNRHAEEQSRYTCTQDTPSKAKANAKNLGRGFVRMMFAVLTAVMFAISVYGFIVVASVTGYWAVLMFTVSVANLFWAFVLLYTQGRTRKTNAEGQGDDNA